MATCVYTSIVRVMVECRARAWAVFGETPERQRFVMNVCRFAWKSANSPFSSW
jgi:hypothetical protein